MLRNFILPAIHLAFILPALLNFRVVVGSIGSWSIVGVIGIILILSYYFYQSEIQKSEKSVVNVLIPVGIYFGAFSTFFLNHQLGLGAVISAGIIGLIGSFSNQLSVKNSTSLPAIIYCGAFVGMSSELANHPWLFMGIASLFTSVFYQLTEGKLSGIGGKLGSIAFGGVFIAFFLLKWI